MNGLQFAIQLEYEGKDYYLIQADLSKDEGLKVVFQDLAAEEDNHAKILENKLKGLPYELKDSTALTGAKKIFKKKKVFKVETTDVPTQIDAYREALHNEQKSIDLYTEKYDKATDPEEKKVFEYLIKQEKEHYELFEGLIELVNRPNEWVEDAEFGNREDY